MPAPYASIAAVLVSVLALISGNSLLNTLVPLRGKLEAFPSLYLGLLGSAFFAAMLVGTLICPILIKRLGYVRSYCVFAMIAVLAALAYPIAVDPVVWVVLRAVIGLVLAGLHSVIDGWVQGKAENENRGKMSAAYQVVHFTAAALGQLLINLADPRTVTLFVLGAVLFASSVIPLLLSKAEPPAKPKTAKPELGWLLRNAPVAASASLGVGAANGSFWSLFPVFGISVGLSNAQIAGFLSATVAGSALAIWFIGRASDQTDRRIVMAGLMFASATFETVLAVFGASLGWAMGLVCFCLGMVAMTIYPTALSHANDRADANRSVGIASSVLFFYCLGAVMGPLTAVWLMERFGPHALFGFMVAVHVAILAVAITRIMQRSAPTTKTEAEPSMPL